MSIKAVIPARAGSIRVQNKNTRDFCGSSLLEICINKLKQLPLDDIIVNSEDDEILEIAKKAGVNIHKRPEELATAETKPKDLAKYIAENTEADRILYVHCTNPFITIEKFKTALSLKDWRHHDSVNSAYLLQKHVRHANKPLYDTEDRPNTQLIRDIFVLEYSLNLIDRENMIKYKDFIGKNPAFVLLSEEEAFDIDTPRDWEIAKFLYEKSKGKIK